MKRNIICNNFSGGMCGRFGQFSAKDITYTKLMHNAFPNRGGTVTPVPYFNELNIPLLKYDKMVAFRFRGENYVCVYDTLLKREWVQRNTMVDGKRVSHGGQIGLVTNLFGQHNFSDAGSISLDRADRIDFYVKEEHPRALKSPLVVIHDSNVGRGVRSFNQILLQHASNQTQYNQHFMERTLTLYPKASEDSFFWNRFLIYNSEGKIVSWFVKRVMYADEDSGHTKKADIPLDTSVSLNVDFNPDGTMKELREASWGGSDLVYNATATTEEVVFYDPTGTLPVMVWRPEIGPWVSDLRAVYHPELSLGYFMPSNLTDTEVGNVLNDGREGRPNDESRIRTKATAEKSSSSFVGIKPDNYSSPFVSKVSVSDSESRLFTNPRLKRKGIEFTIRREWIRDSASILDTDRRHGGNTGGGVLVWWNGFVAIRPLTFPYVRYRIAANAFDGTDPLVAFANRVEIMNVNRTIGIAGGRTTTFTPQLYTSWRLFCSRGERPDAGPIVPTPTNVNEYTPIADVETYRGNRAKFNAWIAGDRNGYGTIDNNISRNRDWYFFSHTIGKRNRNAPIMHSERRDNTSINQVFANVNWVFSAPFGWDIAVPNTSFGSVETTQLKSNNRVQGRDKMTYFGSENESAILAEGMQKNNYWKNVSAALGKLVLSNVAEKENIYRFTASDPAKERMDFSTLDILLARAADPPRPLTLLGSREELTAEGGIEIHWMKFVDDSFQIGTNKGIVRLRSLAPGSLANSTLDRTVNFLFPPVVAKGNEYYLNPERKEIFYSRFSEEYGKSRQFNVSWPLKTDVLTKNKIESFTSLERDGFIFFVAGSVLYMGVVDDSKKDNEVGWCRLDFGGSVSGVSTIEDEVYISSIVNGERKVLRFSPFKRVEWPKGRPLKSYVELLAPYVYMSLAQDYPLGDALESSSITSIKIFANAEGLQLLGKEGKVLGEPRPVGGIFEDEPQGGQNSGLNGVTIGFKSQDDVLDKVIMILDN